MNILDPEFLAFFKCSQQHSLGYMIIGGFAVNYYGYIQNTADLDVWIAPTNENKLAFINTLLCMGYAQNEIDPLYNEDFSLPFKAVIGGIDVLTYLHPVISYNYAEKDKIESKVDEQVIMNIVPFDFLKDIN